MNVYLLGALLVMVAMISTPAHAGPAPEAVCGLAGNSCRQAPCCAGLTCIHDPENDFSTCQDVSATCTPPTCLHDDCNAISCCPGYRCIHDPNTTPLDRCEL